MLWWLQVILCLNAILASAGFMYELMWYSMLSHVILFIRMWLDIYIWVYTLFHVFMYFHVLLMMYSHDSLNVYMLSFVSHVPITTYHSIYLLIVINEYRYTLFHIFICFYVLFSMYSPDSLDIYMSSYVSHVSISHANLWTHLTFHVSHDYMIKLLALYSRLVFVFRPLYSVIWELCSRIHD